MLNLFTIVLPVFFFLVLPNANIENRIIGKIFLGIWIFYGIFLFFYNSLFEKRKTDYWILMNLHRKFSYFSLGIILVYAVHLILLQNNHRDSFFLTENDFISMAEVLNETIKGNFFRDHFHGDIEKANYLAHHFAPGISILIPFLFLDSTRIGYSYGLIFFSLASMLLYRQILIEKISKNSHRFFLFSLFALNPYVYSLFTSYHFEILFLFAMLLLYYSILREKVFLEILVFIFALSIKEDISIYLFLYGIYFLTKKEFLRGGIYIISSLGYFFFFIPLCKQALDNTASENWYVLWQNLGNSPIEIIFSPIRNSSIFFNQIQSNGKVLFSLLGSVSYLPLISYPYYIPLLTIFCIHILSARIWYNQFFHYYSYTILPFFFFSVLEGYTKIRLQLTQKKIYLYFLFLIFLYRISNENLFPVHYKSIDTERIESVKELMKNLPDGAKVSCSFDIGIFLPRQNPIYPIRANSDFREYILWDENSFSPYYSSQEIGERLKNLEKEQKIRLIRMEKKVKLYKIIRFSK